MNKYWRIGLHATYAVGLLLIIIFSGNKYDWMADVDPSISPGAIEDGSGNRVVFLGVVLTVVVVAQLLVSIKAKKPTERLISGLLVFAAILAFVA
jgi:hypothetical protein